MTATAAVPAAVPAAAPAADLEHLTPADRDRWVDALRVGSLLVVVLGHWLMGALTPDGRATNVLAQVPALQPLTWLLQVMPLFFLVGGVAHAHALASAARVPGSRRGRYAAFVRARTGRLLRPTVAYLLVWVALAVAARTTGLASGPHAGLVEGVLSLSTQLLWFVGVYLGVAALAPAMHRWHRRSGLRAVGVLVAGVVVVDVVRFTTGETLVGTLNFALVWLALHQLGYGWKDGLLTRRVAWTMVGAGFGGLLLAVTAGPYPVSMVGVPGGAVSNMAPPTVALLAQGSRALRPRGAAARTHDPRAGPSPGLEGRGGRRVGVDDRVPVAPHRADVGDARRTAPRRDAARARDRHLVGHPAAVGGGPARADRGARAARPPVRRGPSHLT